MLSVNTNTGAMVALQYLNKTQSELATAQTAINTGLKVASAKDDGATYAIAQNMRGNVERESEDVVGDACFPALDFLAGGQHPSPAIENSASLWRYRRNGLLLPGG